MCMCMRIIDFKRWWFPFAQIESLVMNIIRHNRSSKFGMPKMKQLRNINLSFIHYTLWQSLHNLFFLRIWTSLTNIKQQKFKKQTKEVNHHFILKIKDAFVTVISCESSSMLSSLTDRSSNATNGCLCYSFYFPDTVRLD